VHEILRSVRDTLRAPANAVAFALRRRLAWSRGEPVLIAEPKGDLFPFLTGTARRAAERREHELRERFALGDLRAGSTRHVYRENLALLDVLDPLRDHPALARPAAVRAVDVGSRDWGYVHALERFLRRTPDGERPVALTGIEIDGHGIYPDFHARCDHARAHANGTGNPAVRYVVGDFLDHAAADLDVVTMLFPFVTLRALLAWGLPPRLFAPQALFAHAHRCLRPGGALVLLHQTARERDTALALCDAVGFTVAQAAPATTELVAYRERTCDRHRILATRGVSRTCLRRTTLPRVC
jgi:SAM-dependent methyltransferase